MFTCGLLRSNFSLLIFYSLSGQNKKALMEPKAGFEPATSSLPRMRSTPELLGLTRKTYGAGDETRTRDIQLGRLTLYQLSYSRPMVHGVGFEPTYGSRRPGLQPGAINHSTT